MLKRSALVAGLAIGLAAANDAAAQSGATSPTGTSRVRARLFNPFAPFSLSRLTVNPIGLPQAGRLSLARNNRSAPLAALEAVSVPASSADNELEERPSIGPLAVRPPYRPPVRSPYRPPPRPPF
jgi:hypothetical protein